MQDARTVSVSIDRTPQDVYAYAADPRNLPAWSFVEAIVPDGDRWTATVPGATSTMTFVPTNDLGLLDHDVEVGPGDVVHVPMRVVPNGTGAEVLLTVFRRPDGSVADFEADVATVRADLAALKKLLET